MSPPPAGRPYGSSVDSTRAARSTIEDQSADGDFVAVRKSLRPKRETTPGIAKSFSAQGVPAAASGREKVRGRSPRTGAERAKRTALGLGVGSGRTSRGMGPNVPRLPPEGPLLGPEER